MIKLLKILRKTKVLNISVLTILFVLIIKPALAVGELDKWGNPIAEYGNSETKETLLKEVRGEDWVDRNTYNGYDYNGTPMNADAKITLGGSNPKKKCSIENIRKDFLDGATAKNCWYCNIVSTMTNSFLTAVAESNGVVQTLALLILRYGFLIWLAYYILKQVSSLAPIKISKVLQDILMMGFKVLLATLAVRQGIPLLTEFFIDPVMLLGVDYGQEMLDGLMEANIGTTQTPTPGTFGGGSFDGNGATSRW